MNNRLASKAYHQVTSLSLVPVVLAVVLFYCLSFSLASQTMTGAKPAVGNKPTSVLGTWELVDFSGFTVLDSPPHGLATWKFYFADNGTVYVISGQDAFSKDLKGMAYTFSQLDPDIQEPLLTLDVPNQGKLHVIVQFLAPDRMILTYGERNQWTYQQLKGDKAYNKKIEPRSMAILQTKDIKDQLGNLDIRYDSSDYSKLANKQRIVGVWEKTSCSTVPPQEFPPYGFFNEKWIFTQTGDMYVLQPDDVQPNKQRIFKYDVSEKGVTIHIPDRPAIIMPIQFNEWGHLVLGNPGGMMSFKLLSKKTDKIQQLPTKVILTIDKQEKVEPVKVTEEKQLTE